MFLRRLSIALVLLAGCSTEHSRRLKRILNLGQAAAVLTQAYDTGFKKPGSEAELQALLAQLPAGIETPTGLALGVRFRGAGPAEWFPEHYAIDLARGIPVPTEEDRALYRQALKDGNAPTASEPEVQRVMEALFYPPAEGS